MSWTLIWTCLCAGQIALPQSPPGTYGDITFWGAAQVFLPLYIYLAPPSFITFIPSFLNAPPLFTSFSSAPPFFITHIFLLTPGLPRGDGVRTIWPAHYKETSVHSARTAIFTHFVLVGIDKKLWYIFLVVFKNPLIA